MENCKVILNNDYLFYHKADCLNPYNPFMSILVAKNKSHTRLLCRTFDKTYPKIFNSRY